MKQLKNQYVFHSINELINELDNAKEIDYRNEVSDEERDSGWCDTTSYEEARMYMLEGRIYDDVMKDIEKYKTKGTATKSRNQLSVVGHQVVVPLYLQGVPNNMITKKRVIDNKIVTIIYECSTPWHVDSDEIMKTTTELFKNIMSLESQGYRVNLWIIEVNNDYDGKFGFGLRLKTDRETFNIKKIMFPLISSSFIRRIGFRVKERLYKDWIGHGYGEASYDAELVDKFVKRNLGIHKYEPWNYKGKQEPYNG